MASRNQRNTFITGLFVTSAIVASVVIIILLSGVRDAFGTSIYTVRFDLGTNIGGLAPGAEVRVGGRRVGVVNAVEFATNDAGTIEGIDVSIRVDENIALTDAAQATLELPLLGTQGVINFPTLGTGTRLAEGDTLPGRLSPPSILAQAGFGDDERTRVQTIIQDAQTFVGSLEERAQAYDTVMANANTVAKSIADQWEQSWQERTDNIFRNVDETTERGPALVRQLEADLDVRVEEIGTLLATAQAYLDDNRQQFDTIVDNTESITERGNAFADRLNTEIRQKVMDLLQTGNDEITEAGDVVREFNLLFQQEQGNVRKTLANLRLGSDQLRDTLVEVRRSPWRLIYRPDTRELQYELLYDSARTYAAALSDLRAATEAIEAVKASSPEEAERYEELIEQLNLAFEGYQEAERLFIERIGDEARNVPAEE